MNSFKRLLPFIILCALPLAQNSVAADRAYDSQSYYYFGGGIGYGRMNGQDYTNTNGNLSDSNVSWKAMVGARLNSAVSVEVQYIDFGAANHNDDKIQATGWTAGIVFDFLKDMPIKPYGKLGILMWDTDHRFSGISRSQDGTDIAGGLGLRFALSENLGIRTEYERFMMDDTDVDSLSASIQYSY
jgi:OmpA-OmpF porin, OOP family